MASPEMIWNKLNAIYDEVHTNSTDITACKVDIAVVKEKLNNHLVHQDKKTNVKLTVFAIIIGAGVGLLAIFI